ncbi:MAG: ATP-binding cassette domain-containing protein [Deltaproteobacteria bacterium]|nr:ATP-binding cassette domain-containing protein [Candidatus Zymogenaceae bacterium]
MYDRNDASQREDRAAHAVDIRGLTIRFGNTTLFENLSLTVERGEKVALSGPSGSGKTSILKCILGFLVPREGTISVFGRELSEKTVWQVRRSAAHVAQEPELGDGTVGEILEKPFTYRANRHLRQNLIHIQDLCERLLLSLSILDSQMTELSGGEKQRVALIGALLLQRPLLLLDEASSALDKEATRAVQLLLASLTDVTILSVSHDDTWLSFSDRVVTLPARTVPEAI